MTPLPYSTSRVNFSYAFICPEASLLCGPYRRDQEWLESQLEKKEGRRRQQGMPRWGRGEKKKRRKEKWRAREKRDGKESVGEPVIFRDQQIRQQRWADNKGNGSEGQNRKYFASQKEEKNLKINREKNWCRIRIVLLGEKKEKEQIERKKSEQLSRKLLLCMPFSLDFPVRCFICLFFNTFN